MAHALLLLFVGVAQAEPASSGADRAPTVDCGTSGVRATFERVSLDLPSTDPAVKPLHFVARVRVDGLPFALQGRAIPYASSFGEHPVSMMSATLDGRGFSGLLTTLPRAGERLAVGYLDQGLSDVGCVVL